MRMNAMPSEATSQLLRWIGSRIVKMTGVTRDCAALRRGLG